MPEHRGSFEARIKIMDTHALAALAKVMRFIFDWEKTPQGKAYWRGVAVALAKLGTVDGKKPTDPFEAFTLTEKRALRAYLED